MNAEEISLDRYFAALWRAKWLIIILTIIAGAIVAFLGFRTPNLYTASALIEVGRVWKEPLEDSYTTAEVAGSAGFLQELASQSGLNPGRLKRTIKADVVQGGPRRAQYPILVRVVATTENADDSIRLAHVVADEIIKRHDALFNEALAPHTEQQNHIEQRLKALSTGSTPAASELELKLSTELYEVRSNNQSPTLTKKTRLTAPIVSGLASRPSPWRNVLIAALITFITACAAAIVIDQFRSAERTEAAK